MDSHSAVNICYSYSRDGELQHSWSSSVAYKKGSCDAGNVWRVKLVPMPRFAPGFWFSSTLAKMSEVLQSHQEK